MDLITTLVIAVGLAMDAFAVSVASGLAMERLRTGTALRMALFFGFFQAAMPVAGWAAGRGFQHLIAGVDHWVAFGLLSLVGGKMVLEATLLKEREGGTPKADPDRLSVLLVLSVATSIDALAVGISLSALRVPIVTPALVIGAVTFVLSLAGTLLGRRVGHLFESRIEVAGGLLLIGIGVKILLQHLF